MAAGPGKYDDLCTYAREKANAEGAVVMIFGGEHGPGFAVQVSREILEKLPTMLREMADEMDADLVGGKLVETEAG